LSGDVDLYQLNIPTACVQPGYVRTWHKEQATVCIIRPGLNDILADGIDEHRQAAELVEAEEPQHGGLPWTASGAISTPLFPIAVSMLGTLGAAATTLGKSSIVEFAEDEVSGRNDI
jgi:hypothetical protein